MNDESLPLMTSHRPYLLRALYEWIADNGMTPHLLVDASKPGVRVPVHAVKDGRIVLNVAERAVSHLQMTNDLISFSARFGGVSHPVSVPVFAVLAIYARETGQGMALPDDGLDHDSEALAGAGIDASSDQTGESPADGPDDEPPGPPRRGAHLRVVK